MTKAQLSKLLDAQAAGTFYTVLDSCGRVVIKNQSLNGAHKWLGTIRSGGGKIVPQAAWER